MIKDRTRIDLDMEMLDQINLTLVDSRYPSDAGLLPNGFPSLEKARDFYDFASKIFKLVTEVLRKA